jgi:hypothetical protein
LTSARRGDYSKTVPRNIKWREENLAKSMIERSRKGARKRNLAFTITEQDISPLPFYCPVLGTPLNYMAGRGDENSASIDRMDSSQGYIAGNVYVISYRANSLKRDATAEEVRKILSYMTGHTEYIGLGGKPCKKCGKRDRYASGRCRPCSNRCINDWRRRQRLLK